MLNICAFINKKLTWNKQIQASAYFMYCKQKDIGAMLRKMRYYKAIKNS